MERVIANPVGGVHRQRLIEASRDRLPLLDPARARPRVLPAVREWFGARRRFPHDAGPPAHAALATNPTNAASVLKVSVTALAPLRLEFVAQPNLSYAVQFQTNIAATPWLTLSNVAAQPLIRTVLVSDPNPATNVTRFYRAVTP